MTAKKVLETLLQDGFILVFNQDKLDAVKTAEALIEAGIHNMELTCRIVKPLEKIMRLSKELPDFVTGAASLIDDPNMLNIYNKTRRDDPLPDLQQAFEAGATYLVSAANFRKESYEQLKDVPMIPGCGTVTEIVTQFGYGANLCKVFPAKQLGGPAFIKAIDPAIHKTISLVPTGGTNAENIPDYIGAGVLVLGGSFSMIEKKTLIRIIDTQDYNLLTKEFIRIKQLIDRVRRNKWPNIDFKKTSLEQIGQITGRDFNI